MGKKYKGDNKNLSVDNDQLGENKGSAGEKAWKDKNSEGKKKK